MDSNNYLSMIMVGFLVTYPLRLVPALFFSKLKLNAFFQRFLDIIPYTAITALVFPGIFYCIEGNDYVAYAGAAIAIISALLKASLSVTIVCTVIVVYLLLII